MIDVSVGLISGSLGVMCMNNALRLYNVNRLQAMCYAGIGVGSLMLMVESVTLFNV